MGVTGYIKETGDYGILDEIVPYQDEGSDTVLAHLKAGLKLKETDLGPNGLCKLRFADWNDALNVYTDDDAESIFVTMGLGYMLKEMAELTSRLGDKEFARNCMEKHAKLKQLVNEKAWTGEYYAMVLHKDGRLGAPESEGSTIYINPQTWAILGDMIPEDRLPLVLKAMDEKIEHDFGLPVNWPPYEKHNFTIGRMGAFPYGIYENGGAYCHATGFGIVANAAIGRGETAVRLLKKIMPDHELNPSTQSGAEPFVFTNCYFTHPMRYGWSNNSWMTGTSAWCFKGLVEGVLGVERGYDGLTLSPSLPANWKEGKVIRKYRGATYSIKIVNASGTGNGKPAIKVDGKSISGNVLPVFADGKTHEVEVLV
jgi:cellobiose phosphorylase